MRPSALFVAVAASLLLALPARAARIEHFTVGDWDAGAYTHSKTGKFNHCAATDDYKDGTALIFAIFKDKSWAIGVFNRAWKLKAGETFAVHYRIDNGANLAAKAGAVATEQIKFMLPGDMKLFRRMQDGHKLTIDVMSKKVEFKLTSSKAILTRLFDCIDKWDKDPKYQ